MINSEVFPNPTVKQVVFQIRFPNMFFVEDLIGKYQQAIISRFPKSELLLKRQFVVANLGPDANVDEVTGLKGEPTKKVWRFESSDSVVLNVLTDSLDLSSQTHKNYDNPSSPQRFRDAIEFAVGAFLELTGVQIISRIGLRYVDDCPVFNNSSEWMGSWYNICFPLDRFRIEDAEEMRFVARVKREGVMLRYQESYSFKDGKPMLGLDFDAYSVDVHAKEYLQVTDILHRVISNEYKLTLKEPVFEYMRVSPGKELRSI